MVIVEKNDGGFTVNTSAVVAENPVGAMAAYSATKAGLTSLDLSLGRELRKRRIAVLDARPGSAPMMSRRTRGAVTVLVLAALLSPVARDHDTFPLSTYPMFAGLRGRETTFATAVGIDRDGRVHRLSPRVIGGIDDPLVVISEVRNAIVDNRVRELCRAIAGRVDAPEVVAVEVVSERHDTVDEVSGKKSLVERTVHGRCEVSP